jgi:acetoin utilization protein AcuB
MIVREVMITSLITVTPDDTLSHAANLLRQHQFHHLPVVRVAGVPEAEKNKYSAPHGKLLLEGLLTSYDIDMAVELERQSSTHNTVERPWQEQRVVEVMHKTPVRVTPNTSIAAAAQILVERGLNCLPVVEYEAEEPPAEGKEQDQGAPPVLVGLLTRSDLLIALAHITGAFEPGMQLILPLPPHDVTPLAKMLMLAAELHIQVPSVVAVTQKEGVPRVATVYISTIYPAPLLKRLHEEGIEYRFAGFQLERDMHVTDR